MAAKSTEQTFEFDIMAVVIQGMQESGTILGDKHYALMAAVDGKRSKSAFQHLFRSVKARAKDIGDKVATGEINTGVTPVKTKAKAPPKSATPTGSKRKARSEQATNSQSGGASCAQDEDDQEATKTPTKKAKKVKDEAVAEDEDFFT